MAEAINGAAGERVVSGTYLWLLRTGLVRLLPITMPSPAASAVGDWHGRGLCVGSDPDIFFPSRGNPGARAREICTACPVREHCTDYAVEADEFGIGAAWTSRSVAT